MASSCGTAFHLIGPEQRQVFPLLANHARPGAMLLFTTGLAAWTATGKFEILGGVQTRSMINAAVGASAGAVAWTATEYGMHRWILHGPFGTGRLKKVPLGRLHRGHHRDPMWTSPGWRAAGHIAIGGVATIASVAIGLVAPPVAARAAAVAWSLGYSCYEINHWNFHHRAAHTKRGQRLRDRHHQHHFGAPASNLGVTMTFWDQLLDTEATASVTTDDCCI